MKDSGWPDRTHACLIMPPPPGYVYGIDTWDLGYVQHLVSYFVEADSLTLLITGKIEARQYESLLSDIFPTKIAVTSIGDIPGDPPGYRGPELAGGEPFILQSWALYRYLQQHPYDLVVFHDRDAPGFLAIRAKRTGLAFPRTQLITFLHSNHELCRYRTFQMPQDPVREAKRDFAEKYSCEHADAVIVQARCILDWAIDQGWELQPGRVVCLPEVEGTAALLRAGQKRRPAHPAGACGFQAVPGPKVSVCVTHFNQEKHLSQLLPSIAANDYPAFEVVIVDDASTDPQSLIYFEELSRQYPEPRWRFLKNDRNLGPAATRNVAASHATGDYLIFMDGDNVATPTMISDFIRGMVQSGDDCLTCWFGVFRGDDPPGDASQWLYSFAPLGPCLEVGFLENIFGDTNFCIKKSVFDRLGGFNATPGLVLEDWDFLIRLSFHGYNQDVIPRELFWYRHRDDSRVRRHASPRLPDCIYQAYQAQTSRPTRHILTRVTIPAVHQTRRLQQQLCQVEEQLIEVKKHLNQTAHRLAATLNHYLDSHPHLAEWAGNAANAWAHLRQGRVDLVLVKGFPVLARGLAGGVKALTAQVHRLARQGWSGLRRQVHLVRPPSGAGRRSGPVRIGLLVDPDAGGTGSEALAPFTRLGFAMATPSTARTFDYLYAPHPGAPLLSPQHLQNVALSLHHHNYDFVTVAHDLAARPDQAAAPLGNHVVFRSEWLDWFANSRELAPPRPLWGRRLRLLPGPQPLEDLTQVLGASVVVVQGDDIFLRAPGAPGQGLPQSPREVHQAPRLSGPPGPKPVVFVWPIHLAVGGVEKNALDIIRELKDDLDFVVINFLPLAAWQGSFHHFFVDHALGIYDFPELGPSDIYLTMLRSLKQVYHPSLVWICNSCDWLCDHSREIRALFHDVPIVDQEVYSTTEGWIRRYHEPGIQAFDRFIAFNHEAQAIFQDRFQIDPDHIDIIVPAVDASSFAVGDLPQKLKSQVIKDLGIPEDRQIFAFIGRLSWEKDVPGFLSLVRNLQDMGDDSHFLMIGDGYMRPAVDEAIGRYALRNITRIPFWPDISQIYPCLAGLVITSVNETGPIVLLEALACGVPVISTAVGLGRMVLDHYQSGLVVPFAAGERAFADCFVAWKSHLEVYRQGALAGADGVRRQFSRTKIAQDYLDCWNRASQTRLGKPLVSS